MGLDVVYQMPWVQQTNESSRRTEYVSKIYKLGVTGQ